MSRQQARARTAAIPCTWGSALLAVKALAHGAAHKASSDAANLIDDMNLAKLAEGGGNSSAKSESRVCLELRVERT